MLSHLVCLGGQLGDEDRDFAAKSEEKSEAGSDGSNSAMALSGAGKFLINKTNLNVMFYEFKYSYQGRKTVFNIYIS